jgi:hypothetical protein
MKERRNVVKSELFIKNTYAYESTSMLIQGKLRESLENK